MTQLEEWVERYRYWRTCAIQYNEMGRGDLADEAWGNAFGAFEVVEELVGSRTRATRIVDTQ